MCLIYIVNTYPVECAELSYSCWLGMAYWLRFLFLMFWKHASVSRGRRQGAPTLCKKHVAGRKSSFFAHCTVGEITLFLHECEYPGGTLLHKRDDHCSRAFHVTSPVRVARPRLVLILLLAPRPCQLLLSRGRPLPLPLRTGAACAAAFAFGAMLETTWRHMHTRRTRRRTRYERMRG